MLSRRRLLQGGTAAAAGLALGFRLGPARAQSAAGADVLAPDAFVRIAPDNTVTIIAKHIEFGQGAHTGLAAILAEELDADWSQVRVEAAPADAARYNNLKFGPFQGTGGSSAISNSWEQLRRAGATARAMLVAAAAQQWRVPDGEITVDRGVLLHAATGRRATFGELASAAARLTPPASVALKEPKDFKLIGRHAPRVDSRAKTNGSAVYTFDVRLPDMLTAVIARPPRFGATVRSFDAAAARRVTGVTDVVQVPSGVAVVARGTWAAIKGRRALRIDWDETTAEIRGSEQLYTAYRGLAVRPGARARWQGDPPAAFAGAVRILEAVYEFPYLAHATMEPLDCVVRLGTDRCEAWLRLAESNPRSAGGGRGGRPAARRGAHSHPARRRQLRPALHTAQRHGGRGRRHRQGPRRRADDQAHLDPRGRYPGRLVPAAVRAPAARRAGRGRAHRGVGAPDRRTVDPRRNAARR